jgi:hypothetical protein
MRGIVTISPQDVVNVVSPSVRKALYADLAKTRKDNQDAAGLFL